jgi:predicted transcriptional regulator
LLQYFQQKPYFVYVKFLSRNVWMAKRIFRKFEKKTDSYMNRKKISIYIYMYVSLISITVTLEFINVYGKK